MVRSPKTLYVISSIAASSSNTLVMLGRKSLHTRLTTRSDLVLVLLLAGLSLVLLPEVKGFEGQSPQGSWLLPEDGIWGTNQRDNIDSTEVKGLRGNACQGSMRLCQIGK